MMQLSLIQKFVIGVIILVIVIFGDLIYKYVIKTWKEEM